jgi:hypothetical protein
MKKNPFKDPNLRVIKMFRFYFYVDKFNDAISLCCIETL